ncbi:MAG: cupin domain-containing protein [Saprospiraceae bacterium]|nr:cupin domain-containing protein [Saprospiraceae bacterium]
MEPPPHTHQHEDETYYLLEGEMLFRIGEAEFVGKAGDFVFLPRQLRHEFKVLSPSSAVCGHLSGRAGGVFRAAHRTTFLCRNTAPEHHHRPAGSH